jgi:riboflavin kinase / FMN adenylyltransferase
MFSGKVIKGDGVGKRLGFPTANVEIEIKKTGLLDGVYAAQAWLNSDQYRAILVVRSGVDKVEVFLLDYKGSDFYGEELKVEAGEKIDEIGKFESEEKLREKIKDDILRAKRTFEIVQD